MKAQDNEQNPFPSEMERAEMGASRFVSEFGVNMFASSAALLQDEDLPHIAEMSRGSEFHIYAITARPRISIDPSTFVFNADGFCGVFLVQEGPNLLKFPFEVPHPPQGSVGRVESTWPHTYLTLLNGTHPVVRGKAAIFASYLCPAIAPHLDLEVLYIGQSFGEAGEREAPARLQSHSTLQQILGEASRLQPDREIWLALFEMEPLLLGSFDGKLANRDPTALLADEGRIDRVLTNQVSEQQRINFAEAALIRYFEPKYNKTFRKNFPSPEHATYRQCYDVDLNMVAAELDTESFHARLYSAVRPPAWQHHAMFPLHDPKERAYMLDLLTPGDGSDSKE